MPLNNIPWLPWVPNATASKPVAVAVPSAAPVYIPESTTMITLKTVPGKRAKKLARKIQGQITAEDRANTNT